MILYYIYIYINFLPFLCGFSPRCLERWRQGVVLWSEGRLSWQGRDLRADCRKCDGTPGFLCPQTETFLSSTWTIPHLWKPFPPSQSQRKGNPSKGIGPSATTPGFLFLLTNYVHGKNAYFSKPETNKNTNQNPKQTISLEISVDEMSQSQRHSPGTIPALKGSLHLPFYKKTTKQSFQYFPQEQPKKAGSFQL